MTTVNTMTMLIRREFWEHRSLWLVPCVFAALLLAFSVGVPFHAKGDSFYWGFSVGPHADATVSDDEDKAIKQAIDAAKHEPAAADAAKSAMSAKGRKGSKGFHPNSLEVFGGDFMILLVAYLFSMFFYTLDSLLSERRDRSILFWKSLPVSDVQVVASKMLTALIVAPIVVYLLAVAGQLLFALAGLVAPSTTFAGVMHGSLTVSGWLDAQALSLKFLLGGALWCAPVVGYLLVISVWARRNAFLWAILPPIALPTIEYIFFSTHYLDWFLKRRFFGFLEVMGAHTDGTDDGLSVVALFTSPELWAGLAAAAAFVAIAARIRRYRDDS